MKYFFAPIGALVFLCLAVAGFVYLYFDIHASASVISVAREEIATIAARDTYSKAAAQFLAQTSAERSAVLSFETAAEDTAGAIELIEEAARVAKVNATVSSATIVPLEEPHHERLDVVVSADGAFIAQARFGTVLESLPRGSYVKDMRIEASERGWFGTYTISFIKLKSP